VISISHLPACLFFGLLLLQKLLCCGCQVADLLLATLAALRLELFGFNFLVLVLVLLLVPSLVLVVHRWWCCLDALVVVSVLMLRWWCCLMIYG
jgi:hypothetical protein